MVFQTCTMSIEYIDTFPCISSLEYTFYPSTFSMIYTNLSSILVKGNICMKNFMLS